MPLFQFAGGNAQRIGTKEFHNELELHSLIDKNLTELFGLRYITDEHVTDKHGRIETLAIDEANRPVVIEYKKSMESGQLTQANRYMTWVRQNPDSFELLVRKNIKGFGGEIDFSNPRIICFAQEFSIDDKCLALSLGAELWKYRYYENDTMTIIREEEPEQLIKNKSTGKTTIEKIPKKSNPAKTVEEHLEGASDELVQLFCQIDQGIKGISDEIERNTKNTEVVYKTSLNIAYMTIQKTKNALKILFRSVDGEVVDPLDITELISGTGYGRITHQMRISPVGADETMVDAVIDILKQSYEATQ